MEDTVEMGHALANDATSDASKYAVDEKVMKLKEHWESVCFKFNAQKRSLNDLNEDWSALEELKLQLESWIQSAENHFTLPSSKESGSTVTDLEEQLLKHKVTFVAFSYPFKCMHNLICW